MAAWVHRTFAVLALTVGLASASHRGVPAATDQLNEGRIPSGPSVMDAVLFRTHFVDGMKKRDNCLTYNRCTPR